MLKQQPYRTDIREGCSFPKSPGKQPFTQLEAINERSGGGVLSAKPLKLGT
jgi:hypothetical protein